LLDAVEAWARSEGHGRVVLQVTASNDGARRFYESAGFVDTGERSPLREGSDLSTWTLAKDL
jgi:ribosomal protein S18 acetylase RimI-like enzyme